MNKGYHYMHIWLVEKLYGIRFLRKANFSLLQRNKFYLTIMVVVKSLRMVDSILNPN